MLISELLDEGMVIEETEEKQGVFSGEKVVFTGSLETLKRSQAQQLVEDNGGEIAESISKGVTLVVAGESAGSKLEKATKLGIKIINETEFKEMLNQ